MRTLAAPSALLGGRYMVRECLGQGGWGAVYEATQTNLNRTVAIKVLHPDIALSPDRLARFAFEARAAAALGHPNIVQVTDFQMEPGEPAFLVMEMLRGGTLARTVEETGKLSPSRVAWIAHQVLSALDAAHGSGLIHRDVKPENIFLVSATGVGDFVKLLDFGIAKLVEPGGAQVTTTGALLGSPAFMAPEQITGAEIDTRVDLYALGATMYLALTGRLPFDAPNIHSLLFAIASSPFKPMLELEPSLDRDLALLVERALAKDPSERFASAAEMRAALEPWIASSRRSMAGLAPREDVRDTGDPVAGNAPPAPVGSTFENAATEAVEPELAAAARRAVAVASVADAPTGQRMGGRRALMAGAGLLAVAIPIAVFGFARAGADKEQAVGALEASVVSAVAVASASSILSGTAPATSTSAAPSNSASRASRPSSTPSGAKSVPAPPPSSPRFGGRTARYNGGSHGAFTEEQVRAALGPASAAINACYADTELDAPDHQRMSWTFTHDAEGKVKAVHPSTPFGRHAKLDTCMMAALRAIKLPPAPNSGELKAEFVSPAASTP